MKTHLDLLPDASPVPKSAFGCCQYYTVIESFTETDQPVCTRKSLSIPKSGRRAPPAGSLAKEAAGKTVYYGGQFTTWSG